VRAGNGRRGKVTLAYRTVEPADSTEAVKLLLAHGGDVNKADLAGTTALHAAAMLGANEMIQFLADHGANLDARDELDKTPLDWTDTFRVGAGGVNIVPPRPESAALLRRLMGLPTVVGDANPQPETTTAAQ